MPSSVSVLPRSVTFALAAFLLAGCTTPGQTPAPAPVHRVSDPETFGAGVGFDFAPPDHPLYLEFLNLTTDRALQYEFRVDDMGTGRACFVSPDTVTTWLELMYPGRLNGTYEVNSTACASGAKAEVNDTIPPGAWVFAFAGSHCPQLDCGMHVRTHWNADHTILDSAERVLAEHNRTR